MKKIFLLAALFAGAFSSFATIHVVRVSNYQFSPKTTNAIVGDTIVWIWKEGSHTTTSTTIPAGATPWDSPINSSNKRFGIRVTEFGIYNYKCIPHASSGMRGTINVTPSLTAGLHNFNVTASGNDAFISWKTQQDDDIAYYSIKRSVDADNFSEVTRVSSNSGAQQTYNYTDKTQDLENKFVYYMLEMVDKNGNKQLSDIKLFTKNVASSKLITSISPNPITSPGHLMMQFNADAEGKMLVQLYNSKGAVVKQTEMSAVKGLNNGHFHLGTLLPGTYYVQCTLGKQQEKYTILFQ